MPLTPPKTNAEAEPVHEKKAEGETKGKGANENCEASTVKGNPLIPGFTLK